MPTDVISSSGTWTAPAGIVGSVLVEGWSGAGGGGSNSGGSSGGGGGGGGYVNANITPTAGDNYTVTVGVGGLGGVGGNGGMGGNSVVLDPSSVAVASVQGGNGGVAGGLGGAGGFPITGTGFNGGNGGNGSTTTDGGGGGGSATSSGNGGNGANGITGGAGGTGTGNGGNGATFSANAQSGSTPGGGGGGGGLGGHPNGATASPGQVQFTYTLAGDNPPTRQASQRLEPLPEYNYATYEQQRRWPTPTPYIPTPPPSRQANQRIDALPDNRLYTQYAAKALPQTTITPPPMPPVLGAHNQRVDPLPDFWVQYQPYLRTWPTPAPYIPAPPASQQPSQQLSYTLPEYNYVAYEQRRTQPIPIGAQVCTSAQIGACGVYGAQTSAQCGAHRVANNIAGYNLYVGLDALPDLTQTPTAFSATLPFSYTLPLPGAGTRTYYLLVQTQDQYRLVSQNQFYTVLTLDSSGNQITPPMTNPDSLQLYARQGQAIRVLAQYAGFGVDTHPATVWHVWIDSVPINTANPPTAIVDVLDAILSVDVTSYAPGLWYVGAALFRSSDSALSTVLLGTITVPPLPTKPAPVAGGAQLP